MIGGYDHNPYVDQGHNVSSIQEVAGAILRLERSFGQRSESTIQCAQEWLDSAIQVGIENGIFSPDSVGSTIERKVGSGFNTSIFLFNADNKEWVLKIGAQQAPVPGWLNPSCYEYAEWYSGNLNIFHSHFERRLPYLIPWPQHVMYAENHKGKFTTLVIQPYISNTIDLEDISFCSLRSKIEILEELAIFYDQCEVLHKKYNFIPDFGSKKNVAIQNVNGHCHFILLDNGMIDFTATSPVLNGWSKFIYHYRLKSMIALLEKQVHMCDSW